MGTPRRLAHQALRKAALITLLTVIALCFLLVPDADSQPAPRPDPLVDGVHVIGDSIGHRVHRRPLAPRHRPNGWTVDTFPGRRVTALGNRYHRPVAYPARTSAEYAAATRHTFIVRPLWGRTIRTAVVALGTNGADHDLTVAEASRLYAKGIRVLRGRPIWKPGKRIILITPWRDPTITEGAVNPRTGNPYPPYTWAEKSDVYTSAILRVAHNSTGICVMRWDQAAAAHPEWFRDGVHPNLTGQREWKRMLYRAIRGCHA